MNHRSVASLISILALGANAATAQSRQLVSVQGSGMLTSLHGTAFEGLRIGTGLGGELQVRINPGFWSLGGGLQVTRHASSGLGLTNHMTLAGIFLEPRYAFPMDNRIVRPYVAGRLSILRQSTELQDLLATHSVRARGLAIGGGGGFVARVNDFVGFDLGIAATTVNFGTFKYQRSGVDTGQDAGSGVSFVVKAGLNIGLGKQ